MLDQFSQAACTSFLAVVVLAVGQIIIRFVLDPIHEQRKVIGEITFALTMYANVSGKVFENFFIPKPTPPEEFDEYEKTAHTKERDRILNEYITNRNEAKTTFRRLASELLSATNSIPFYEIWVRFNLVRPVVNIREASTNLIGMSNSLDDSGSFHQHKQSLIETLSIKIWEK